MNPKDTTEYTMELWQSGGRAAENKFYRCEDWMNGTGSVAHFTRCFKEWGATGLQIESMPNSLGRLEGVVVDPAGRDLLIYFFPTV